MANVSTIRVSFISLIGITLFFAFTAPTDAARKSHGCTDGRFVVTEGLELLGDGSEGTVLVVDGSTLTVQGTCPASGSVSTRRKGTRISANWEQCGALAKLRLRATARDCRAIRGTLRARKRRAAFVATASTCGDSVIDRGGGEQCDGAQGCEAGVQCSPSCHCEGPAPEPLECEVAGYPCAWNQVPADVRSRSVELADQAAAILAAGGSMAEAAQALEGGSPVELQYDERLLRFRLPGGRPVWLGREDDLHPSGEAPVEPQQASAANGAGRAFRRAGLGPRAVLSPGAATRSAYVLDPFAYDPRMAGQGAAIAGILQDTRSYEGNVKYLANGSIEDPTVTAEEFRRFAGHSVVYVASHGGYLCNDLETGAQITCRAFVVAARVTSPVAAELEKGATGVDVFRSEGAWSIALGGDFFRHHYPGGLRDALVMFDACATYDTQLGTDIARALEGPNSNFVGWSEPVSSLGSAIIVRPFMGALSVGRAMHEVYESMKDGVGVKDRYSSAYLVIGNRDVRIRDLPRLIDGFTGETLSSNGRAGITGFTDDDKPDSLVLLTEFEGIGATEGDAYRVHFTVNGDVFAGVPLSELASPHNDYRWSGSVQLDLAYDVSEGQTLDIEVTVVLPEGGTSKFTASPRVTGPRWSPGRKWQGTFIKLFDNGVVATTLVVQATFVRDPEESGDTKYPTFILKEGTMTWSLTDVGGDDCNWSAPATTTELAPDESDYFTFDMTKQPVEYTGYADTKGPRVPLTASCWGDTSDPPPVSMEAGGVWFTAYPESHFAVNDGAFGGEYSGNAVSLHSWSVTKVE